MPSQNGVNPTTACCVRIKYGQTFQIKVAYHSKEWAQKAAYLYVNDLRSQVLQSILSIAVYCYLILSIKYSISILFGQKSDLDAMHLRTWQYLLGKRDDQEGYNPDEPIPTMPQEVLLDKYDVSPSLSLSLAHSHPSAIYFFLVSGVLMK